LLVFGLGLALTSVSLTALGDGAPRAVELAVLTAANLLATVIRFMLLRSWVFRNPAEVARAVAEPRTANR
jgi:hypothetical protein